MADQLWLKLEVEEKVQHKVWRARVAGLEELVRIFNSTNPEFTKYKDLVIKFAGDNNAVAQEKGLEAAIAYAKNAPVHLVSIIARDLCQAVISKCVGNSRSKVKLLAQELLVMLIEIGLVDLVQEELLKGLDNKQPKLVAGCVQILKEVLRLFGSKIFSCQEIVKQIPRLLEDRDKNVRDETKALTVEIYHWVGAVIKSQLTGLKSVQVTELQHEFDLTTTNPQPERFVRVQHLTKENPEENQIKPAKQVKALVNINDKLPLNFYEKLEAKKWQERRDILQVLQNVLEEQSNLDPGVDYSCLVQALRRVIAKDSTIILVISAAQNLSYLATALNKKFGANAACCTETLLGKFREKKLSVVIALRHCVDACYQTTTLEAISELVVRYLNHKTPSVRTETASFLMRCFCHCKPTSSPTKVIQRLIAQLVKNTGDQAVEVREATFEALGIVMKVLGENYIMPLLTDLGSIKLAKVKEYQDKVTVMSSTPSSRDNVEKIPIKANKKSVKNSMIMESLLTQDGVDETLVSLIPPEFLKPITSDKWKERLNALQKVMEVVNKTPCDELPVLSLFLLITRKPGLRDNNLPVLKLKLDVLLTIVKSGAIISKQTVDSCVQDLVEKIGDVKYSTTVQELLLCLAEATLVDYVSQLVVDYAFTQKSPKNQAETINWLQILIKEFGVRAFSIKPIIYHIKSALSASNPAVRSSAVTLIGVLHMYIGSAARTLFHDEKPTLLQLIDDEIAKVGSEKPPEPVRGLKCKSIEEDFDLEGEEKVKEESNKLSDILTRSDISGKITRKLLDELNDKNWKVRSEALQKIETILHDAKLIESDLGDLPINLAIRLTRDSNKILVTIALGICQTLGTAIGSNIKQHIRILGPAVVSCFGDTKLQLRQAAVGVLNTWWEQCGLACLMEAELFSESLKLENPTLRAELLGWLAEKLPNCKKLPAAELNACIPHVCNCLEDRNSNIRQKAHDLLGPLMAHMGYSAMFQQANKLKPSSRDHVLKMLQAHYGMKEVIKSAVSAPDMSKVTPRHINREKHKDSIQYKSSAPVVTGAKDERPILCVNFKGKEQRFKNEKALKLLKWSFTYPTAELIHQLHSQMELVCNELFLEVLFSNEFRKHLKAVQILTDELHSMDSTVSNLDLIFKWLTVRFYDTNASVLLKCLEYVQTLVTALSEQDYQVTEQDAKAFLPHLICKIGDPKDNIRRLVCDIVQDFCEIYSPSKVLPYLMNGIKSKSPKQRGECLCKLGHLIEAYGVDICQPSPTAAITLIVKHVSDRDATVRSMALSTLVQVQKNLGEQVSQYIDKLTDKERSFLDDKIQQHNNPESCKRVFRLGSSGDKRRKIAKLRPPSPSVKLLQQSTDVRLAVEAMLRNLASTDAHEAISALDQLRPVLEDPEKSPLLLAHVDQMVLMMSRQLQINISRSLTTDDEIKAVTGAYHSVFCCLFLIFQNREMARLISPHVIKDIIRNIIHVILDSRLANVANGMMIIQYANSSAVKVADKSDPTIVICTLIEMIHECVSDSDVTSRYLELTMKCTWKMVRSLPEIIRNVTIDDVLYKIHMFLCDFPISTWSSRACDLPLRTIKSMLQNITKLIGPEILHNIQFFDDNSDTKVFVKKLLHGLQPESPKEVKWCWTNDSEPPKIQPDEESVIQLDKIFTKIGSSKGTLDGLNELYEFKQLHPNTDLEPYLKKLSKFFQTYIRRGLRAVESTRKPKTDIQHFKDPMMTWGKGVTEHVQLFQDRIDAIHLKCGFARTVPSDDVSSNQIENEQQ